MKANINRAHPWHGIPTGPRDLVNAYIEMCPTDTIKYELDKESGLLKIDRPHLFSSQCPTLYGLIPRTFCSTGVAQRFFEREDTLKPLYGDRDPLDICILCSSPIIHGDILVQARPVGGLAVLDGHDADDKIIAVLDKDAVYGAIEHITEVPLAMLNKIKHYFVTYKDYPGAVQKIKLLGQYDAKEAFEVIDASIADYKAEIE